MPQGTASHEAPTADSRGRITSRDLGPSLTVQAVLVGRALRYLRLADRLFKSPSSLFYHFLPFSTLITYTLTSTNHNRIYLTMGDHATLNDPAANAPDAAFAEKGKGKAQEPTQDLSMDEDESESESENEMVSSQFNGPEEVL